MAEKGVQIEEISTKLCKVKVIISDVEGTTTSIPFVKNTLLSYYLDHLNEYLRENWGTKELQDILLKVKYECDSADPISTVEEAEKYIHKRADSDHVTYSQRLLQTKIWEEGYSSDGLKGHLFPDVVPAFKKWTQNGKRIYLYSSGLELAQKLLFTHSVEGDVFELISGCFDTTIGSKYECESYKRILEKLECQPDEALFLTDNVLVAIMKSDSETSEEISISESGSSFKASDAYLDIDDNENILDAPVWCQFNPNQKPVPPPPRFPIIVSPGVHLDFEADAALKAGIITLIMHRQGNASIDKESRENFPVVSSFEEITPHLLDKKKKSPDAVNGDGIQGKKAKLDDYATKTK